MRLTTDQIKQGILHPTQEVRDASVYYFTDCYSTDSEIMHLTVQTIDKFGWDDAFGMYSFLQHLVQTEETLSWTIDQLRHRRQPNNETEACLTSWLLDALTSADPVLLKAHEDDIRDLEAVDEDVLEAVEERILLHGFTAEKLWQELEEFCEHNKTEDYLTDEDIDFAHRLVEAMGRHFAVFDAKVLEILAQDIKDYSDNPTLWMEPCIVRLAGDLRLQQAIPLIVKKLHEDDDLFDCDCIRSLKQIGTDAVADALADEFREAERGFRVASAEIFEKIHSDRSVERCLALLEWEEILEIKCRLAQSALMNFADEAVEPARQLVLNNELNPDVIEVRSDLLVASTLIGIELPEGEQWREDAKHDVEFRKKWYAEHYRGYADDEEYLDDDDDDYDEEPLSSPDTIVSEKRKIGRNDPCPCGSGRKYKKCCLKKQDGAGLID